MGAALDSSAAPIAEGLHISEVGPPASPLIMPRRASSCLVPQCRRQVRGARPAVGGGAAHAQRRGLHTRALEQHPAHGHDPLRTCPPGDSAVLFIVPWV